MPVLGCQYYHLQPEDPVVVKWALVSAIINLVLRLSLESEE